MSKKKSSLDKAKKKLGITTTCRDCQCYFRCLESDRLYICRDFKKYERKK